MYINIAFNLSTGVEGNRFEQFELINLGSNKKCFSLLYDLAEFNDPECNDFDYNRTRERNNRVRSFLSFVPDPNEQLRARFSPEWNFEREPPFHPFDKSNREKKVCSHPLESPVVDRF